MSLLLLLCAGAAGTTAPTAEPSGASLSYYAGDFLRLSWTNGDSSASTQWGWGTSTVEPASVEYTVSPGGSSVDTGQEGTIRTTSIATYPWVRHVKNSQYSDWVRSSNGYI